MACLHFGLVYWPLRTTSTFELMNTIEQQHRPFLLLFIVCFCCVETEKGIFDAILHEEIDFESQPWPSISESAKDLVRKMLTRDPKKRLTSAQVLRKLLRN